MLFRSPGGSGNNIVVPDENYKVYLHKSSPTGRLSYSAVIVERTPTGWTVSGYDSVHPYFTIIPSEVNNNAYGIEELGVRVAIYKDYQRRKLTVPYGYEFKTHQLLADFITSYARYLKSLGFVFDEINEALAVPQDWDLSIREFLTWSKQGWQEGSILVLSPAGSKIKVQTNIGVIDEITNKVIGNRLLDQNFSLIRKGDYTITRDNQEFTATTLYNKMIALADLSLVEYEHVLIFDNKTVFNDVLYLPELGNRQYRLKLIGYKTGNWTGQLYAPGYIYNTEDIDAWQPNKAYNVGSLVEYKNQYYLALEKVSESTDFNFIYWSQIDKDKLKTGLLPNLSNKSALFKNFYDGDAMTAHEETDAYWLGLTGFRQRQYLQDLGIDRTTQFKFYQGYIKQKGTLNAIDNLTTGVFDRIGSEVNLYEEWALRVGEYGATGSDQFIEVILDDTQYTEDPATVYFLNKDESYISGVVNYDPYTVYRYSEEVYDKFFDVFEKNKPELVMKGINSFSGYVTYMLEQTMQKDKTFARYAPKIEKIAVDEDRVVLKDNIKNRIAEVTIQKGELFCQLCEEKDCVHIGYVFSLPDVYEILNSRGIKHPR